MATSVLSLDGPSRFYGKLLPGPPGAILVLGAGDGLVAAALATRGFEVVAVEPSTSLRALIEARLEVLSPPQRFVLLADDPRTLDLGRTFQLVLAPHQALGLARTPDELEAFFATIARHLAPDGLFAFDALHDAPSSEGLRARGAPHLRERSSGVHALAPLRLSAQTVDAALASVGLAARERFADFSETPFSSEALLQVVVGGAE